MRRVGCRWGGGGLSTRAAMGRSRCFGWRWSGFWVVHGGVRRCCQDGGGRGRETALVRRAGAVFWGLFGGAGWSVSLGLASVPRCRGGAVRATPGSDGLAGDAPPSASRGATEREAAGFGGPGPPMAGSVPLLGKHRKKIDNIGVLPHQPVVPPLPHTLVHLFHPPIRRVLGPRRLIAPSPPKVLSQWTGAPASASTAQTGRHQAGCWQSAARGWPRAAPPGGARRPPAPPPAPPRRRPGSARWTSPP